MSLTAKYVPVALTGGNSPTLQNSDIYVDGSGNVGIGTASPNSLLNIKGNNAATFVITNQDLSTGSYLHIYPAVNTGHSAFTIIAANQDSGYADIALNIGDIYTDAWEDYSATSTIVGWSSFSIKKIYYKKIGKLVFVNFELSGTSDGSVGDVANFTVPYTNNVMDNLFASAYYENNSSYTDGGHFILGASSTTVNVYRDKSATAFTKSGTKAVKGSFFYQSA
jgi:hypothetical protein